MTEGFEVPSIVYKYRDPSNPLHMEILTTNSIFLPSPPSFNDPFDCQFKMDFHSLAGDLDAQRRLAGKVAKLQGFSDEEVQAIVERLPPDTAFSDAGWLQALEQRQLKDLNDNLGVLCLSAEPDNLLLWAHYGDHHRGIAIGFDTWMLMEACAFELFGPVAYHDFYSEITDYDDSVNATYSQVFHKSTHWSYEKEFRGVRKIRQDALVTLPQGTIKEVHLGCNIAQEQVERIKALKASQYHDLKIIRYRTSPEGFFLLPETLM